jgi:hypothetical protein
MGCRGRDDADAERIVARFAGACQGFFAGRRVQASGWTADSIASIGVIRVK